MDIRTGPFIDWLSIRQYHDGGCPVVNDGELFRCSADGELVWNIGTRLKVEGSFDTSCYIRSDGHSVEFTGNPARWGREDNVFGYDLAGSLAIINGVLATVGLPSFSSGHRVEEYIDHDGVSRPAVWTGARVSRIDVTRNYEAGTDADARGVLAFLQRQQISGARGGLLGETTVQFTAGRRYSFKLYLKGHELRAHCKGEPSAVTDWALSTGLLRAELTLRSTQLADLTASWLGDLEGDGMARVFSELDRKTDVLRRQAEVTVDPLAGLPRAVEATARRYMDGVNVRETMSRAAFYKHRKVLLHLFDIAVPPPHRLDPPVKPIILRDAVAPSWYSFSRSAAPLKAVDVQTVVSQAEAVHQAKAGKFG